MNILEVASKKPSVQRVVFVSSSSTTYSMMPEPNGRQIDISEWSLSWPTALLHTYPLLDSWNDAAVTTAWDESIPHEEKAMAVYAASRIESERESWKWMEANKPHFVYNTVVPCFNVSHPPVNTFRDQAHEPRSARSCTPRSVARRWALSGRFFEETTLSCQSLSVRPSLIVSNPHG